MSTHGSLPLAVLGGDFPNIFCDCHGCKNKNGSDSHPSNCTHNTYTPRGGWYGSRGLDGRLRALAHPTEGLLHTTGLDTYTHRYIRIRAHTHIHTCTLIHVHVRLKVHKQTCNNLPFFLHPSNKTSRKTKKRHSRTHHSPCDDRL